MTNLEVLPLIGIPTQFDFYAQRLEWMNSRLFPPHVKGLSWNPQEIFSFISVHLFWHLKMNSLALAPLLSCSSSSSEVTMATRSHGSKQHFLPTRNVYFEQHTGMLRSIPRQCYSLIHFSVFPFPFILQPFISLRSTSQSVSHNLISINVCTRPTNLLQTMFHK